MINKNVLIKSIIIFLFLCSTILGIIGFAYSKTKKQVDNGFYLNGENDIILEYGDKYEEAGFIANINNKSLTRNVQIDSNVNINKVGDYQIKYTLSYKSYKKTLIRNIRVADHTFPTLNINCDVNQYISVNGKMQDCKITANDNYDKDITDRIIVDSNLNTKKVGDYKVTYTVSDSSTNKVSKTINVHVRKKFDITYVKVSISKQKLEYYQNNKLVLSTPITSGRNNYTKTGNFKVINKARNTTLKGADYESFVQYWMGYGGGYGLHDASWRRRFGTKDYNIYGSHGCINMPTNAAKKLYNMIEIGTPIYIKK